MRRCAACSNPSQAHSIYCEYCDVVFDQRPIFLSSKKVSDEGWVSLLGMVAVMIAMFAGYFCYKSNGLIFGVLAMVVVFVILASLLALLANTFMED